MIPILLVLAIALAAFTHEPEPTEPMVVTAVGEEGAQDPMRFKIAMWQIKHGLHGHALKELEANITETPGAHDIDYAYAWATLCAAQLGDLERTLSYYSIMRTRFNGWVRGDVDLRSWEVHLAQVKQALAARGDARSMQILGKVVEIDQSARGGAAEAILAVDETSAEKPDVPHGKR